MEGLLLQQLIMLAVLALSLRSMNVSHAAMQTVTVFECDYMWLRLFSYKISRWEHRY